MAYLHCTPAPKSEKKYFWFPLNENQKTLKNVQKSTESDRLNTTFLNECEKKNECETECTQTEAEAIISESVKHETETVVSFQSSSKRSSNHSQILELESQMHVQAQEYTLNMEKEKIKFETKLAALKIQEEFELKSRQKKIEFMRKQNEIRRQLNELHESSLGSETSYASGISHDDTVRDWIDRNTTEIISPSLPEVLPTEIENPQEISEPLLHALNSICSREVTDLPEFSGNIVDWPIFENEFYESTAELKLSHKDNLRRLIKSLQGKARNTVEALLTSHENVPRIMKILKTNFGRTEWIVGYRLETLRQLRDVEEGNIEAFRHFYNVVIGTSIALKNAKAERYFLNPELVSHIADKLPPFSKQRWICYKAEVTKRNTLIDFVTFVDWLEQEMEVQLANFSPFFSTKNNVVPKQKNTVMNINENDTNLLKSCPLCKESTHSCLEHCRQFKNLTLQQRRATAKNCDVCFVCLKVGHNRRNCRSGRVCSICAENHNHLVHQSDESEDSNCEEQYTNTDGASARKVLLRVGKVKLKFGDKIEEIVALFDEGSSITMLDNHLVKKLNLTGPLSRITYKWTNGITHTDDNSMSVNVKVAAPYPKEPYYELKGARTADLKLPEVKIDISRVRKLYPSLDIQQLEEIQGVAPQAIIGSNNAGLIVPLKTIQYGINGLQKSYCNLGWTIHGPIRNSSEFE